MMEENQRPRYRFRLKTILLVVAIVALLMVVVIQQVQIGRMRQLINTGVKERADLATIIHELQDHVHRQR